MFCGDNILVEKINKLIIYTFMSYSYECYEEVHSLLDGVLREGVTKEVTLSWASNEVRIQPNGHYILPSPLLSFCLFVFWVVSLWFDQNQQYRRKYFLGLWAQRILIIFFDFNIKWYKIWSRCSYHLYVEDH